MMRSHYVLSDDDFLKITTWLEDEVWPAAIEYQKETIVDPEKKYV